MMLVLVVMVMLVLVVMVMMEVVVTIMRIMLAIALNLKPEELPRFLNLFQMKNRARLVSPTISLNHLNTLMRVSIFNNDKVQE